VRGLLCQPIHARERDWPPTANQRHSAAKPMQTRPCYYQPDSEPISTHVEPISKGIAGGGITRWQFNVVYRQLHRLQLHNFN